MNIGTGTNTPSASNAGWIGTYPGSLAGGMCARSAETKTERSSEMAPEEQRLKKNQESLESYNWYKAHHICVRCNNAAAVDGFVTCQKCREAMNASNRFRYAALTPEQKAERSAKKKAVRAAWQAAGLCTRCGGKQKDPNLLTCERCRKKDKRRGGKRKCRRLF